MAIRWLGIVTIGEIASWLFHARNRIIATEEKSSASINNKCIRHHIKNVKHHVQKCVQLILLSIPPGNFEDWTLSLPPFQPRGIGVHGRGERGFPKLVESQAGSWR